MDESLLAQKEREMREKYPESFGHPECRPGELWLGDAVVDVVGINAQGYREAGLSSARVGDTTRIGKVRGYVGGNKTGELFDCGFKGIFANVREFIEVEERHKQSDARN